MGKRFQQAKGGHEINATYVLDYSSDTQSKHGQRT